MDEENKGNHVKTNRFDRKLVCVTYPGIVNNVDYMIRTLGGITKLENAVANRNKRLELKFRPRDIFAKPATADRDTQACLLVKIIVRIPENKTQTDDSCYEYEVVGVPTLNFSFNKCADFQYLPLGCKEEETSISKLDYLLENLYPFQAYVKYEEALIKDGNNILPFFPPRCFLKYDIGNKLYFERVTFYEGPHRPELLQSIKEQAEKRKLQEKSNYKSCGSIFFNFDDKNVPDGPCESVIEALERKTIPPERYTMIKECFDKRPIWSKIALQHKLGLSQELAKVLLPTVAYYHRTGPWRIMWTKYGYDPRTDPEARIYQTFDFRMRTAGGIKYLIEPKRYKVEIESDFKNPMSFLKKLEYNENFYTFQPNVLPPARQMFYQYCDLHLPKIQTMIKRLPKVSLGTKCDHKTGWLPHSFSDQCREILCKHIYDTIQSQFTSAQLNQMEEVEEKDVTDKGNKDGDVKSGIDVFDLMEISDTDEETDEESDRYASNNSSDGENEEQIDQEILEDVNQVVDNKEATIE